MPKLHLFFPENDLALAKNTARYTAPPTVVKLRRAGATLPLWYGAPGDFVLIDGVNSQWYNRITNLFNIGTKPTAQYCADTSPAPWGWSLASRHYFEHKNTPDCMLPTDAELARIRNLSHRHISIEIGTRLEKALQFRIAPTAKEFLSVDDIKKYIEELGSAVIKLPWSSSGRGVIPIEAKDLEKQSRAIEGILNKQGSVLVEPLYDKTLDFASLFEMNEGKCTFQGLSVFETTGFGSYSGNILASTDELHRMIDIALGNNNQLDALLSALPPILKDLIGKDYNGAIGIDMMAVNGEGYTLVPAVELNLRMTMGHVCHRFYRDYVESGKRGRFTVGQSANTGIIDCEIHNTRITKGTIDLAQPGSDFSFLVSID